MEFSTEHDKIAVNELGECFDFDTDVCTMSGSDAVCQGDNIKWQRRPITCAQSLAISRSVFLPSICYKTMRIVTCKGQAYLRQLGKFFIYSPYADDIISSCEDQSYNGKIVWGLNVIPSTECQLKTTDLAIPPPIHFSSNRERIENIFSPSLPEDMNLLFSKLDSIHGINLSK